MMSCVTERGSPSGFTLIELVVVLSIVVVLSSAVAAAITAGIMVWDVARHYDVHRIEAMLCLERLERDLRSTFAFPGVPFVGEATTIQFAGVVDQLAAVDASGATGRRIVGLAYTFDPDRGRFARYVSPYPLAKRARTPRAEDIVEGVVGVHLSYMGEPDGEPGNPVVWVDRWEAGEDMAIPRAVTIKVTVGRPGSSLSVKRTIHLPAHPLMPEGEEDEDDG